MKGKYFPISTGIIIIKGNQEKNYKFNNEFYSPFYLFNFWPYTVKKRSDIIRFYNIMKFSCFVLWTSFCFQTGNAFLETKRENHFSFCFVLLAMYVSCTKWCMWYVFFFILCKDNLKSNSNLLKNKIKENPEYINLLFTSLILASDTYFLL